MQTHRVHCCIDHEFPGHPFFRCMKPAIPWRVVHHLLSGIVFSPYRFFSFNMVKNDWPSLMHLNSCLPGYKISSLFLTFSRPMPLYTECPFSDSVTRL